MKVLLVNGSPNEKGCTYTALSEITKEFAKENIDFEIIHIGNKPIRGCSACYACKTNDLGKCVFDDDCVNEIIPKMEEADGIIIGSPVYFAGISGQLKSFLDRSFFAGKCFDNKPGASVVSCRRGGASASFDQLNHYFTIRNMPLVSSQYWNQVHGAVPEDVLKDAEGLQTMRTIGKNMAWLLKCIENADKNGIPRPVREAPLRTNFIQ